jgi:hypothetical protein
VIGAQNLLDGSPIVFRRYTIGPPGHVDRVVGGTEYQGLTATILGPA